MMVKSLGALRRASEPRGSHGYSPPLASGLIDLEVFLAGGALQ